jgi:3-dehydroquinate dehydratase-1
MGPLGAVTRVAGGLFGSDLAFAVGTRPSAPGQIPLEELRRIEGILIPRG